MADRFYRCFHWINIQGIKYTVTPGPVIIVHTYYSRTVNIGSSIIIGSKGYALQSAFHCFSVHLLDCVDCSLDRSFSILLCSSHPVKRLREM